eukprot:755546_1
MTITCMGTVGVKGWNRFGIIFDLDLDAAYIFTRDKIDIENNGLLLYQRGTKSKYFTLLLDGKCEVYAGRQAFRCELSRWSYLCPEALDHCVESYEYNKPNCWI